MGSGERFESIQRGNHIAPTVPEAKMVAGIPKLGTW
jgi:hypothetical protein